MGWFEAWSTWAGCSATLGTFRRERTGVKLPSSTYQSRRPYPGGSGSEDEAPVWSETERRTPTTVILR